MKLEFGGKGKKSELKLTLKLECEEKAPVGLSGKSSQEVVNKR